MDSIIKLPAVELTVSYQTAPLKHAQHWFVCVCRSRLADKDIHDHERHIYTLYPLMRAVHILTADSTDGALQPQQKMSLSWPEQISSSLLSNYPWMTKLPDDMSPSERDAAAVVASQWEMEQVRLQQLLSKLAERAERAEIKLAEAQLQAKASEKHDNQSTGVW